MSVAKDNELVPQREINNSSILVQLVSHQTVFTVKLISWRELWLAMPCRSPSSFSRDYYNQWRSWPLKSEICPSCRWHPWQPRFQRTRRKVGHPPALAEPHGAAGKTQRTDDQCPLRDRDSYWTMLYSKGTHWWYYKDLSIHIISLRLTKLFFKTISKTKNGKWTFRRTIKTFPSRIDYWEVIAWAPTNN